MGQTKAGALSAPGSRSGSSHAPDDPFDHLWGIIEQELLRYGATLRPNCEGLLRQTVQSAVPKLTARGGKAHKLGPGIVTRKVSAEPPTRLIVIEPYPYPHIMSEPPACLTYGVGMHTSPQMELAEIATRTVILGMIRTAKEAGRSELGEDTFDAIKGILCPMWPFWKKEDCLP
jgi:hypothetical protein